MICDREECDQTWLEDWEEVARAQAGGAEQRVQRETVSSDAGGRRKVLHVLNSNANVVRGKGMQGTDSPCLP